jgi:hypothetical protein
VQLLSRSLRLALIVALLLSCPLFAGTKEKDQRKIVDSGKFGIFVSGNRVGTEAFSIEQTMSGSQTHCDLTIDQSGQKIEQTSDMSLAPNGDLLRYEWKELSPGKASSVVTPDNTFLLEHLYSGDKAKPFDRPFMMPASTVILDDFFFTHRELLAWRYIGTSCRQGGANCNLEKTKFGGLVPHTASPILINIQYKGPEKVTIKGAEQQLRRFDLDVDGTMWTMWMDDAYKIMRIVVPTTNTEVLRD